ncbi:MULTISPECIES: SgcJ/EcaC family oxidoreductase [Streptomyces]|uniref:SgcJ/EcaC family oxidoreductase n=1 Tax=Streptomyces TaxID=1883 RepID=UPI000A379CD0|nr:SgcJ/EcaC family oxidoreductase [Streptomyces viridochromogenes]
MESTGAQRDIVSGVVDRWKAAVDAHDPQQVASCFTEDAIFQGLRPYSVGRSGVAEYYDSQPLGLKAHYDVLEVRELADDVLLGYLGVDFSFVDRPTISVNLGVVLKRVGDKWLIGHYQVSKLA